MKIPDAKGSSCQGMEKAWDNSSMGCEKSQKQKGGHKRGTEKTTKFTLIGRMPSKEFGVGATIPEVQRKSRASRRHCESRLRSLCSIYWTGLISITNGCRKGNGRHCSTTWMYRTSSWRNIGTRPGKNGGCSKTTENSQIRTFGCMDSSSKTQMAEVMGIHWGSCCSSWTKLFRTPTRRTLVVKTVRESIDGTWLGKSTKLGMLFRSQKTKYSYRSMWMTSKWPERSRIWLWCGRNWWKTLTLRSQYHFLITFTQDALNGNANQTRKLLGNATRCSNPAFLLEQPINFQDGTNLAQKLQRGPTTWKDMLGNAWNVLRNGKQKTEQLYKVSHPCLDEHQIKKEELENKGELSFAAYCLKMLVTGTIWSTWHSVVSQQTGTVCHKMDSSMWQTTGTINFLHSFHEWLPPTLSCGQCGSTLSIGVISRFRLCRRSWRLKINIRRSFVHFWKSNIYTVQLDVQEANVSVSQLHRIRDHIVGCWFAYRRFTCAWLVGFGHWSAGNDPKNTKTNPSMHKGNWCKRPKSHPRLNKCWIRMWIYRT